MKILFGFIILFLLGACHGKSSTAIKSKKEKKQVMLTSQQANQLAQLPINCIQTEFPNKLGQVIGSANDLAEPRQLHPAFYGCFDWHSAVHGHWSLVMLLKQFPDLDVGDRIRSMLEENITQENILNEVAYFDGEYNGSYERTYGWAWLLKLADELLDWDDPMSQQLAENLQPLTERMITNYIDFLPRLRYPIRVGTHTNTAFGLCFSWDYACNNGADSLKCEIEERARAFFWEDTDCPIDWEPSGYDFLSPCLEEIDLMRRVLGPDEFAEWMERFAPQLKAPDFKLEVAEVIDRTDGHLVHLDGLNFSRAWVLYGLANQYDEYGHLRAIADEHMKYSIDKITDGNYEGEHWLASFALYAFTARQEE